MNNLVKTSYSKEDVVILLQDVDGKVPVLDTVEREKLNQRGVHYSEMLPLEYVPTPKYMEIYEQSLDLLSAKTAKAVMCLAEKLVAKKGKQFVIVSLARAGTPIGILVKRYIKKAYNVDIPHYSVSIIRGKGIDKAAMNYIVEKHGAESVQFLDGWVGKGAINKVLTQACDGLKKENRAFEGIDSELAVLSDPAGVTELYGTVEDFLIPSACLNSTVSGLISRTVCCESFMTEKDLHGAVYYGCLEGVDQSINFLTEVESHFSTDTLNYLNTKTLPKGMKGIDEVLKISRDFGISDINKIKPGLGETTRVLLRRVPDKVLISPEADKSNLQHILRLCEEKNVPVEVYPLEMYSVCGIIKDVADL